MCPNADAVLTFFFLKEKEEKRNPRSPVASWTGELFHL
jgi:hypothetical protein